MAQKLVQGGIKAVRSGDHDLARKAFTQALKLDPNNEAAWLGMATITDGNADKLRILNKVLEINPDNDRAQEAIRRLGGGDTSAEPDEPAPVEPIPSEPESAPIFEDDSVDSDEDDDSVNTVVLDVEADDEDVAEAIDNDAFYATGEIEPLTDMPSGDTGELSDFPIPDWSLDEDIPGVDDANVPDRVKTLVVRSSDDVFAAMPKMPTQGSGGIPTISPDLVDPEAVEADVQAYLEEALADYLVPDTTWTRKERGRAGSTEYRSFLLQAGAATFVATAIILTSLIGFLVTNPATRRIIFAPTWTPEPSPTNTPSPTPGVTNTPSPTPEIPASETPSLPLQATLGFDDPNFPPQPTEVYYPDSVVALSVPDDIVALINEGELDEARDLIDEAIQIEIDTGEFPPTYLLSQWHLAQDDSDSAREVLLEWQEEWQERDRGLYDNSESLFLIALADIDVYEARNGIGNRFELLDNAQTRLEASLGIAEGEILVPDRVNSDGYVLLAEVYALRNNTESALSVISDALGASFNQRSLLGDTELRMAAARILAEAQRYPEAFQQLYFVLEFNPFLEEALILQTELALESGQAGLGVLYAQQYLLYYPGSLQGLYLLGQAREAESKFDLALNAYSRAVAGDVTNETYTSDPFFLDNLLARATLLTQQGQRDLASEDFSLALQIAGDNPAIRARRLAASFAADDYEAVLLDAEELIGARGVNQSDVFYYQGLALIEQARAGNGANDNYDRAIESLNRALDVGLASALRPIAQENLAFANLEARNYDDALVAINNALDNNFTADRLYLRGQILDGQGSLDEALIDYEFLVTWGQYFNFPFYEEVLSRYEITVNRVGIR